MIYQLAAALRWKLRGDLGRRGEDLAHGYLRRRKYLIVARNYRSSTFVEVKTRASDAVSFPERAVDDAKQRHILRTARDYARRANVEWSEVRFDIIAITGIKRPVINHLKDAFSEAMRVD